MRREAQRRWQRKAGGIFIFDTQDIVYRSDPEALRRVVPEPREITKPLVRFEVVRMPDSTAVGDRTESGQVVTATYDGERGEFSLCM